MRNNIRAAGLPSYDLSPVDYVDAPSEGVATGTVEAVGQTVVGVELGKPFVNNSFLIVMCF